MLADGFEEIEALATIDVLRRAGMDVCVMSINDEGIACGAHNVVVVADVAFEPEALADAEWVILPGGMPGASNLAACEPLTKALKARHAEGKRNAAICASPALVFAPLGLLDGKNATCYPSMENLDCEAKWCDQMVVVDANVTTGRGPAAAVDFGLAIVAQTCGEAAAREVAAGMLHCRK